MPWLYVQMMGHDGSWMCGVECVCVCVRSCTIVYSLIPRLASLFLTFCVCKFGACMSLCVSVYVYVCTYIMYPHGYLLWWKLANVLTARLCYLTRSCHALKLVVDFHWWCWRFPVSSSKQQYTQSLSWPNLVNINFSKHLVPVEYTCTPCSLSQQL